MNPQAVHQMPVLTNFQQGVPIYVNPSGVRQQIDGNMLLQSLDHVVIREKIRMSQVVFGIEQANIYAIEAKHGPYAGLPVMYAKERSNFL